MTGCPKESLHTCFSRLETAWQACQNSRVDSEWEGCWAGLHSTITKIHGDSFIFLLPKFTRCKRENRFEVDSQWRTNSHSLRRKYFSKNCIALSICKSLISCKNPGPHLCSPRSQTLEFKEQIPESRFTVKVTDLTLCLLTGMKSSLRLVWSFWN